ncbi:MAG: quinone-dependent dihydroorotate dehydrogenase [Deltaproteobacteria bacterium]|nr:quinone-dependent dihydroorotate dehydrogenase [Deltaproteobacteria bacterium]
MYTLLFNLVLRRLPAEMIHHFAFAALRLLMAAPLVGWCLKRLLRPTAPALRVRAMGLDFPSPVGLAAGFDKNAMAFDALAGLGFGFIEVGTLTGEPQPGNPQPRLFRLPADRALINRMGFNNDGAMAAAARLQRRGSGIVGGNIGKTKVVPEEAAIADYVKSTRALGGVVDYLVVNVSSPNTPGLRNLQAVEKLSPLLQAVRTALDEASPGKRVPLLVKIAPDLADDDVDAVADMALSLGLDGIIATNTTISREGLRTPKADVDAIGAGGLSGAPVKQRALQVLRRLSARTQGKLVLVAAGGIETADDVYERLKAGATLVQLYTGFIYGGPLLPWRLNRGLAAKLAREGVPSVLALQSLDA